MADMGQLDLSKLVLPQQVSPLPLTTPSSSDPFLEQARQSAEMGREQFGQTEAVRRALGEQIAQKMAEQSQVGPMSYQPKMKPFNSFGDAMGDIGKALLSVGAATGPGRAIQSQVYAAPREKYGRLAEQISGLQKQQEGQTQALGAEGNLGVKSVMAAGTEQRGAASVLNAQNRAVHDRATEALRGELQKIQQQYNQGKLTQEAARTQAMILIGRGHDQAIQSVAGTYADQRDRDTQVNEFEKEWQNTVDNMFRLQFGNILGISPTAPSASPTAPPGPKARGSKVALPPRGTRAKDPQGNIHVSDGSAPLPPNWTVIK